MVFRVRQMRRRVPARVSKMRHWRNNNLRRISMSVRLFSDRR